MKCLAKVQLLSFANFGRMPRNPNIMLPYTVFVSCKHYAACSLSPNWSVMHTFHDVTLYVSQIHTCEAGVFFSLVIVRHSRFFSYVKFASSLSPVHFTASPTTGKFELVVVNSGSPIFWLVIGFSGLLFLFTLVHKDEPQISRGTESLCLPVLPTPPLSHTHTHVDTDTHAMIFL